MQLRNVGHSKNIEVKILTNTKTRFGFSDNIILLDKAIVHGYSILMSNIKTPSFTDNVGLNILSQSFITLSGNNDEQFNIRMPLLPFFKRINTFSGVLYVFDKMLFIKPKMINWRNCFIDIPDIGSTTIPSGGLAICLTIFYDPYNPDKHKLNGVGELIESDQPHY